MNDHDLSPAESARLTSLLRRAADQVDVPPMPDLAADAPTELPATSPRGRRRFTPALVAAVVVVVAGVGAWWVTAGDGSQSVDVGPARPDETGVDAPPVAVSPTVLEQTGVWRLPEGLDDHELVAVDETGFSAGGSGARGMLAADHPDDQHRWMLVEEYPQFDVPPAQAEHFQLSAEVSGFTVTSAADDGPIWFQLESTDDKFEHRVLSGAVRGVDPAELAEALADSFGSNGSLMAGEPSAFFAEQLGLSDGEQIRWAGDDNHAGDGSSRPSIELMLLDPTSRKVVVQIAGSDGTPGWAQAIRFELTGDLSSIASEEQGLGAGFDYRMVRRNDLGPNVVETTPSLSGWRGEPLLTVFTDDGVMISTDLASAATEPQGAHLTVDEQLQVINSLRSVSEEEFVRRAADSGADVTGLPGG